MCWKGLKSLAGTQKKIARSAKVKHCGNSFPKVVLIKFSTWLREESTEETLLMSSQELTRKMVQNQTIDIKTAKR